MNEKSVQVPVSLIERTAAEYERDGWQLAADKWRALLSQPTPTAVPPRIEDMAPGTKLWCELGRVAVERDASGRFGLRTFTGYLYDPADIGPSTIRDVTPPKDAA